MRKKKEKGKKGQSELPRGSKSIYHNEERHKNVEKGRNGPNQKDKDLPA